MGRSLYSSQAARTHQPSTEDGLNDPLAPKIILGHFACCLHLPGGAAMMRHGHGQCYGPDSREDREQKACIPGTREKASASPAVRPPTPPINLASMDDPSGTESAAACWDGGLVALRLLKVFLLEKNFFFLTSIH